MYTNEQVAVLVKRLDARLATIEAALAGTQPAPVGAPVTLAAASPLAIPDKGEKSPRYACSKHAEHKDGKGFTVNGRAAHAAWCDGTWSVIASE